MPMTRPRTSAASSEKRRCSRPIISHQPLDLALRLSAVLHWSCGLAGAPHVVFHRSGLQFVDALLELANPLPHGPRDLRDAFGAEDEQNDDEDEEQFFNAESAEPHTPSGPVGSRSDLLNLISVAGSARQDWRDGWWVGSNQLAPAPASLPRGSDALSLQTDPLLAGWG